MRDLSASIGVIGGAPFLAMPLDGKGSAEAIWSWRDSGLTVRLIRGRKMRSIEALFNEVAAALQFPHYFGENWPAFGECLADMDWLPMGAGIAVLVSDPGEVLIDEDEGALATLVRAVDSAAATYAEPIALGEWWDRAALSFHVVLQMPSSGGEEVAARWQRAGARISSLSG